MVGVAGKGRAGLRGYPVAFLVVVVFGKGKAVHRVLPIGGDGGCASLCVVWFGGGG